MSNGNKERGGNIALLFVFWLKDPGGHLFTGCCPNPFSLGLKRFLVYAPILDEGTCCQLRLSKKSGGQ